MIGHITKKKTILKRSTDSIAGTVAVTKFCGAMFRKAREKAFIARFGDKAVSPHIPLIANAECGQNSI
ncbi:MAG: hypothetical protein Q8P60_02705 [Pseudorhodobacter sp.]|nr:hypothetical protein [Pseudorhodobacter sp.]